MNISSPSLGVSSPKQKIQGEILTTTNTVKPVLNRPFIERNFVLNGNILRSHDYHSIPWLNGNLASAEKYSGHLRFRLRQVLLYYQFWWKHKYPSWLPPVKKCAKTKSTVHMANYVYTFFLLNICSNILKGYLSSKKVGNEHVLKLWNSQSSKFLIIF
jgi:hypothetical protein